MSEEVVQFDMEFTETMRCMGENVHAHGGQPCFCLICFANLMRAFAIDVARTREREGGEFAKGKPPGAADAGVPLVLASAIAFVSAEVGDRSGWLDIANDAFDRSLSALDKDEKDLSCTVVH